MRANFFETDFQLLNCYIWLKNMCKERLFTGMNKSVFMSETMKKVICFEYSHAHKRTQVYTASTSEACGPLGPWETLNFTC